MLAALVGCSDTATNRGAPTPSAADIGARAQGCAIAELLVPSCGAWIGSSVPSLDGLFDHQRGIAEFMSATETDPDIVHLYSRGSIAFPSAEQRLLVERPDEDDRLFYFSWKPSTDRTWRQIANGEADDAIEAVANGLVAFGDQLFLTIHHEPENDVDARPESGMNTDDYAAMYRYVVGRLRFLGVDNAVFVMTYMGFERWAPIVDALYPGDDVVDWIAYDPYGRLDDTAFADILNRPNQQGWPGFYSWATAKAPGKPMMLAEWGFDLADNVEAAKLLENAASTLATDFSEIKAVVYWNGLGGSVDARLARDTDVAESFARAYGEFARHSYFDQAGPVESP